MKIGHFLVAVALSAVLSPLAALGADEAPLVYVIKKGDTLWGLSERFLKDPYYWPDMWSKNSQITNPHLIYPGQTVRIFPDRIEIVPKEQPQAASGSKKSASVPASLQEVAEEKSYPVRGNEVFLLEDDIRPQGVIVGLHSGRIIAANDDIVYTDIGTAQGGKPGSRYTACRKELAVTHPVTNEVVGTKVSPLGIIELSALEQNSSNAIVVKTYREINPGAFLLESRGDSRREVKMKMPARDFSGHILDNQSGTSIISEGEIVFIDLGTSHGAEPGNMLYVVRDVKIDQKFAEGRIERLPKELLGALVILESGARTSTALVVKSIDALYRGDTITTKPR